MGDTNMDTKNNPTATVPILEFSLPKSEVEADLAVGEHGEIIVPCQVVAVGKDTITFRKDGVATAARKFGPEELGDMRKRIGVVEDEESPMHKKDDSEDTDE